jgi:predicted AAA+ superfamily ATPase
VNKEGLLKALIDWNFWYKEQFTGIFRDRYVEEIIQVLNSWNIASVLGVKRAGKSTIINQVAKRLIENGTNPFNILIVNFEDSRFSQIAEAEDLFYLYDLYKEEIKRDNVNPVIFLDEVQRVKNWEGFARSLIDRKEGKVVVSGSTSELLNDKVRSKLAGRHIVINVYPLSFTEFMKFKKIEVGGKNSRLIELVAKESEIKRELKEFLMYGGFPSVVVSEIKEKTLGSLFEDIIAKDVIQACKIKDESKIKLLTLYLISNVGNRINFRNISRQLMIPLHTIQRFSNCLVKAKLVYFVKPISPKFSEMVRAERKVYAVDQGMANVVGYRLNTNFGALLENLVFLELARRYGEDKIFYYRGKTGEVDFLIKDYQGIKEAYQVTYEYNERELKGIKEILDRIPSIKIITYDEEGEIELEGRKIQMIKVWKFLLSQFT